MSIATQKLSKQYTKITIIFSSAKVMIASKSK